MSKNKLFNYRQVDETFSLSGGWQNVVDEIDHLVDEKVVGILDLQFANSESEIAGVVSNLLEMHGIEHFYFDMRDGWSPDLGDIYAKGIEYIDYLIAKYPEGRILVKCGAGMSRSVSMLAAWYAEHTDMPLKLIFRKIDAVTYGSFEGMSPTLRGHLQREYGTKGMN